MFVPVIGSARCARLAVIVMMMAVIMVMIVTVIRFFSTKQRRNLHI